MTYAIRFAPNALLEMQSSATWWAENRSREQATRWLMHIRERFAGLSNNPERHPLARESSRMPFETRELLVGIGIRPTHRVLFRIADGIVEVLTLRHVSRGEIGPNDLNVD